MTTLTYETFTSAEILEMFETLGYPTELTDKDPNNCFLTSCCFGIAWKLKLFGPPPFHFGLLMKVPLLISGDPFAWVNTWNQSRFTQAVVHTDPISGKPIRDRRDLAWVSIDSLQLFQHGVTPAYVLATLDTWIDDVLQIHNVEGVKYFKEFPS